MLFKIFTLLSFPDWRIYISVLLHSLALDSILGFVKVYFIIICLCVCACALMSMEVPEDARRGG